MNLNLILTLYDSPLPCILVPPPHPTPNPLWGAVEFIHVCVCLLHPYILSLTPPCITTPYLVSLPYPQSLMGRRGVHTCVRSNVPAGKGLCDPSPTKGHSQSNPPPSLSLTLSTPSPVCVLTSGYPSPANGHPKVTNYSNYTPLSHILIPYIFTNNTPTSQVTHGSKDEVIQGDSSATTTTTSTHSHSLLTPYQPTLFTLYQPTLPCPPPHLR